MWADRSLKGSDETILMSVTGKDPSTRTFNIVLRSFALLTLKESSVFSIQYPFAHH